MKPILILAVIVIIPMLLMSNPVTCNDLSIKANIINSNLLQNNIQSRSWHILESKDYYDYEFTGTLTGSSKYNYYYNPIYPSRVDSVLLFTNTEDIYTLSNKLICTYDINTSNLIQTDLYYMSSQPTILIHKALYHYDNQNRLLDVQVYKPTLESYMFINSRQYDYQDNTLSSVTTKVVTTNPPGVFFTKSVFQHDTNGRICNELNSNSTDSLIWSMASMNDVSYTTDDTSTGQDYIDYISHAEMFNFILDTEFIGKIAQVINSTDYNNGVWEDRFRVSSLYDDAGMLTEKIGSYYVEGEWVTTSKAEFDYDENNNCIESTGYVWNSNNQAWSVPMNRNSYLWGHYTSNEDAYLPVSDMQISAYPNPFRNDLQINLRSDSKTVVKADVYNIKGQLVKSLGISKNQSFKWDGKDKSGALVGNGIYFIKVNKGGISTAYKVIKIK